MQNTDVILYPSIQYLSNCSLEFALSVSFLKIMTVTIYMYIDWQLAVNGRNVVKNDKTKIKKWMLWEDLHRISRFIIYFSVVVWLLRIVTPEIESKIWIGKSMSERWIFFYLINFLTKLRWVLTQEHSKLYCTFLETRMYLIYFFDLIQIVTQTLYLVSYIYKSTNIW